MIHDGTHQNADFTVTQDNRLVAYVWLRRGGLRKAGKCQHVLLLESDRMDILLFDSSYRDLLEKSMPSAEDFGAIKFKMELEGCQVLEGYHVPRSTSRRF